MLILLPPSEGKTQRRRGRPLDLATLSFPSLTQLREQVLCGLMEVSGRPDALSVLEVGASLGEEVARNTRLRSVPTAPAGEVYSGVLFDALDLASLDTASRRRANRSIVIISALFGAVRPADRIPAYRLRPCVRLPEVGEVGPAWRPLLRPVLDAEAEGARLIVDCRSSTYAAAWRPRGDLAKRRVEITVPGASHMAKHTRGLVARTLVQSATKPRTPQQLAALLASGYDVDLSEPARPGQPWWLAVSTRN